jgi:hypothetical protein
VLVLGYVMLVARSFNDVFFYVCARALCRLRFVDRLSEVAVSVPKTLLLRVRRRQDCNVRLDSPVPVGRLATFSALLTVGL